MSDWERNLRETSSRQPAGDSSRYRYHTTNSIGIGPREEQSNDCYYYCHRQAINMVGSSPRDIGAGRESAYNRSYPGYRPQGTSSRTMSTYRSFPSLGSIHEERETYRQPEPSSTLYHESHAPGHPRPQEYALCHEFYVPARPRRQEFVGPFADHRDRPIFEDIVPSMEFTDSSGSSTHSSITDATLAADERQHVRYPSIPLDQLFVAPPRPPAPHIKRAPSCPTIEVAPGEFLRLRGAAETSQAIQNDFYIPAECVCCNQTILCIQDADYVLCPDCRVVVPLRPVDERNNGGVGLGCKPEDIFDSGEMQ